MVSNVPRLNNYTSYLQIATDKVQVSVNDNRHCSNWLAGGERIRIRYLERCHGVTIERMNEFFIFPGLIVFIFFSPHDTFGTRKWQQISRQIIWMLSGRRQR